MLRAAAALGLALLRGSLAEADGINLILPPKDTSGRHAALVMISGMQVANTAYQPMLEKLQDAAAQQGISLFAGAPWYLGNIPQPVDIKYRIGDVLSKLQEAGMDASAPQFYAAHSLGTVFLQDYVKDLGGQAAGQILMGGFLLRKHITPQVDYPVPTLTLGAEVDGLARVTRMAESYYHQKGHDELPVVVLMGQNHMQFASGAPPANVEKNDLAAEVDEDTAHGNIASVAADFIASRMGLSGGATLQSQASATAQFLQPIVDAYELEGSRRFNMPAQVGGPQEDQCVRGLCPSQSPWAPTAQQLISAVDGYNLQVTNAYVLLKGLPLTGQDFHLPAVTTEGNTITITTYSQCYWNDAIDEVFEDLDTAFTFTSAQEIGTKLESRQCTINVGTGGSVDFSVDDPDFCAQTNQKAYDWALEHAPSHSADRFRQSGVPLVMGQDIQREGGPLWLDARLEFNQKTQDGRAVVEVVSPAQKTDQDYWKEHFPFARPAEVPDPGCYHYCKLLSPARALEWILVDGLRAPKAAQQKTVVV